MRDSKSLFFRCFVLFPSFIFTVPRPLICNPACTLLYSTLLYSTLLYSTLLYSTLPYSTLLYSTLLYSTLLYLCIPQSTVLALGFWSYRRSEVLPPPRAFGSCPVASWTRARALQLLP